MRRRGKEERRREESEGERDREGKCGGMERERKHKVIPNVKQRQQSLVGGERCISYIIGLRVLFT